MVDNKNVSCIDCFFFFQAEDGIRDTSVTGVQTCALPIWHALPQGHRGAGAETSAGGKIITMDKHPLVSIVMGSDSDLEIMNEAAKALAEFGIPYEIDITSAHRSPARTSEYSRGLKARGVKVVIAGAGGAAHLAGVIAAETTLPVIAVPIPSTALLGLDSLLAMVQMPAGIPVATVAIGKPGATNAGILAAQM